MIKFEWVDIGDILFIKYYDLVSYSEVVGISDGKMDLSKVSYMSRTKEVLEYCNGKWILSGVSMAGTEYEFEVNDITLYKSVDYRDRVLGEELGI